ncbi:30S ribosomal protein S1 [Tautonia sociabilis]|uniref:S1 RNA-binding domain-containing protein n=1 Tax=Tautonia sociabilis TaxID=2080755 RepID=A0A432ML13_9BACT|nr:S1 RNA-binding domain-containing protein [Tautonia sociabilis]RUL88113.1 S1 RNA-binding domain-containing protein [Tautonia sociabilis]
MSDDIRNLHEPPAGSPRPRPGQSLKPEPDEHPLDAEINRALDSATGRPVDPEVELKRQWDEDLEAELEKALEGFDPEKVPGSMNRRARSEHVPAGASPGSPRGPQPSKGTRTGTVVRVRENEIIVDLGTKSEGFIPVSQFGSNKPLPNVGDSIEVMVDRYDPTAGLTRLNLKGAAVEADWESVQRGMVVEARVTKAIKGGLEVEVDCMRGFLPVGQIELGYVADPEVYVNQRFQVIVTEANPREKNLVVSRKALLEQQRAELREKTWAELQEGQVRKGTVRSIKDFGAFVDLGGVDGLIHVSDLAWSRGVKVEDVVKIGDEVEVKVLKIEREKDRVGLGLKQLAPSPWDTVEHRYGRGQVVKGKVVKLMEFGAFVEIEPGVEGLIHISELAPGRVRRVRDVVQEGQDVDARILDIDAEQKRMSLSIKPTAKDEPLAADEEPDGEEPPKPKKVRKVPLKGGLGDRDAGLFG